MLQLEYVLVILTKGHRYFNHHHCPWACIHCYPSISYGQYIYMTLCRASLIQHLKGRLKTGFLCFVTQLHSPDDKDELT